MANENIIFISTHSVQMIIGSCDKTDMIKIRSFKEVPLEEGAMINGVITDESQISDILKEFHDAGITHARIVIDSGQVMAKNVEVPALKPNELIQVVKDELANLDESYEDLLYDYSVLRKDLTQEGKVGGEILCCAVERKFIKNYVDVFESSNIKIDSIDISVNALHKLTQELADLDNKTYIVSVLDANNVTSYLFENNHYTFSNRTRLFSDRGTMEFIAEMNSNISQLIQFNKSKRSQYTIENAYFCGLQEDEKELVIKHIRENLDIQVDVFPNSKIVYLPDKTKEKEFRLENYVYSVGCMIRK